MRFVADFHIHSRYSRATSRELDLEHLELWARRKGVAVVGTGDFTHPGWFSELKEKLEPAEPGLFRLKKDCLISNDPLVPPSPMPVRFVLSAEISSIYKKGEKVRKVHNLILMPDFEDVEKLNLALGRVGNLHSDGRPILGLDSKELLKMVLESSEQACFIPAHIWTPWFSILGSRSGFDSVEECFDEMTSHIFALETGLSSDPPMNWRLSGLDRFALVSNSDAHSPGNLAREANVFDTEMSYFGMRAALAGRDPARHLGTIEFFPQEGKYHYDGHRKCGACLCPKDTRGNKGLCPVCGRAVTVGVMHRVEELADRGDGHRPEGAAPFRSLIPLAEIISEIMRVGKASRKVADEYFRLLQGLGPELDILELMGVDQIANKSEILAEAVRRMREGRVIIREGYDGEYGVIRLFEPEELESLGPQKGLFASRGAASRKKKKAKEEAAGSAPETRVKKKAEDIPADSLFSTGPPRASASPVVSGLNHEQEQAVKTEKGPIMIVAGPGTGKTRTLTHRIAYLVLEKGIAPEKTLAVTFTNKAKEEMTERLSRLIPDPSVFRAITIRTFHGLGLQIIKEESKALALDNEFTIVGEDERIEIISGIIGGRSAARARSVLERISDAKQRLLLPDDLSGDDSELITAYRAYREAMRRNLALDYDDLILLPVRLLKEDEEARKRWQARFDSILIDEYQDINQAQYEMVKLLSPSGGNLCVIGDPDQAIYGFRGAEVKYFFSFSRDYPDAKIYRLEKNYRSSDPIIKASRQVISSLANPHRPGLFSEQEGPRISMAELASERAEAEFVVHQIERMVGGTGFFSLDSGRVDSDEEGQGMSFSDIGVLYRMDALSRPLIEAFERSGIPFQKVGEDPFARDEIRPIIAVLNMVRNSECEVAAREAICFLLDQGSPGAFRKLDEFSRKNSLTLQRGLDERHPELAGEIRKIKSMVGRVPVVDLIDRILELPGLTFTIPEGLAVAGKFLRNTAAPFGVLLDEFLEARALASPQDFYNRRADRVALLTMHAAKGLEFGAVFIIGCEDGIIPYTRRDVSRDETEEERRLFYVGVTRARRLLYLTRSKKRALFGPAKAWPPSPFLRDIEEELTRRASLPSRKAKKARPQLKLF